MLFKDLKNLNELANINRKHLLSILCNAVLYAYDQPEVIPPRFDFAKAVGQAMLGYYIERRFPNIDLDDLDNILFDLIRLWEQLFENTEAMEKVDESCDPDEITDIVRDAIDNASTANSSIWMNLTCPEYDLDEVYDECNAKPEHEKP